MILFAVSLGVLPPRPLLVLQATVITLTVLIWTAPPLADLLLLRTEEGLDPVRKASAAVRSGSKKIGPLTRSASTL